MGFPQKILGLACFLALWGGVARADYPYLTEEASSLTWGQYSLSAGLSRTDRDDDPVPGGTGVVWTIPQVEGTMGLGPRAEVAFQYEYFYFDPDSGRDDEWETGDLRLWTKFVLLPREVQTLALRFGVKLPNASDETGLGTDETDFFAQLLCDVRAGPAEFSANAGLGILGAIEEHQAQDDVFLWAAAVRGPLGKSFRVGVDASGQAGTRRGNHAWFALVGDHVRGPWRFSLAGRLGAENAEGWGWVAGVSYDRL